MRRLCRCSAGSSAVEFALVAPVFLMTMMQIFNLGQMAYGKVLLTGAVEQAARASALETANTTTAHALITSMVRRVLPGATVTSTRKSYYDFADIDRKERWNDANANGTCDAGEAYTDENRSGGWETDVGASGNGSANDVVIYAVTVSYTPMFSVPFTPSAWRRATLSAASARKNQPFANQTAMGSAAGTCT